MELYFKSNQLRRACNRESESIKKWGREIAIKLQQRLNELKAADTLSDISYLPPARLHELTGEKTGIFAVDLKQPFRLLFEPAAEPVPLKKDGSIDKTRIRSIRILEVIDYHDHKRSG